MDGLWKMSPKLGLVVSVSGWRSYSAEPDHSRTLMKYFRYEPFTECAPSNKSMYLGPLTLMKWMS